MTDSDQNILTELNLPTDLRQLDVEELGGVCAEVRQYIIDVLSENPGHLASSLGTVELSVALHYVFNTPHDRIVWDVGHQAYGHKIITGRRDAFKTLRKYKGVGGFPNPNESEYDSFIAGHASTSISAALGMSVASSLKEEDPRHVVAVIGDGAMTGGLAFEGLNNAATNPNNLLIILNDNNMAIDNSVGALSQYLVDITTSQTYNKMRYDLYRGLRKLNIISEDSRGSILRFNNSLKALLTKQHNLFEGFSIRYFGPIDGHDISYLVKVLNDIKDMKGPKLLHIRTLKGKGYLPAERSVTEWHAPGKFDVESGVRKVVDQSGEPPLFQDVFGHTLVELAKEDKRIVGVTPAMPTGCSMTYMMKEFPDRTFDVGIAEAHAVTFSAGMAKEGLIPFCNIYSTFLQRAFDQMIHDVALQKLPFILCIDRGGLVGEDGATHHGVFDLAFLSCIPNLTIASPLNEHALRNLMYTAYKQADQGPFVIRYPRGKGVLTNWRNEMTELPIGKGYQLKEGSDVAILSIGPIGNDVTKAIEVLKDKNISIAHYDMCFLKPLDDGLLHEIAQKHSKIVTVENGTIKGGLGSAVLEFMSDNAYTPLVKRIGVPDCFVEHGTINELLALCKMDTKHIAETVCSIVLNK
jgi:1-deoxy-D-xylulose-5-phosphate synthase